MRKFTIPMLAFLFLISCTSKSDKVERIWEDGVEVIINHLEHYKIKGEPSKLILEEEFRIDTERDEILEIGLSDVYNVDVDSEGNIYLVNNPRKGKTIIFKFDEKGKFISSFGKKGQGPGEIINPSFFCICKNDEIVITDFARINTVMFNKKGEFLKEIRLPFRMRAVLPLENGKYIGLRQSIDREGFEPSLQSFLCLYSSEFSKIKELDRQRPFDYMTTDKIDGIPQIFHWEVHDRRIYTGNGRRGYEISVYDLDGNLVRKIRKKYKPIEVPEEYKQNYMSQFPKNHRLRKKVFFSTNMPPYREFFVDDAGRIFVMTYEKNGNSEKYMYDIFNHEGILIMRKYLNILLSGESWGMLNYVITKKNKLYYLRTKDSGYKELVVYKMRWEL